MDNGVFDKTRDNDELPSNPGDHWSSATRRSRRKPLLNCALCLGHYKSPKLLPCLHTFCEQCLRVYVPAESLSATCPICRQQSILPRDGGVSGLPDSIFVTKFTTPLHRQTRPICSCCEHIRVQYKCIHCDAFVCEACSGSHGVLATDQVTSNGDRSTNTDESQWISRCLVCTTHQGHSLAFYCSQCETAICELCTSCAHHSHPTMPLDETIDKQRELITQMLKDAHDNIDELRRSLTVVNEMCSSLQTNYSKESERISESFDSLVKELLEQKQVLLSDLNTNLALHEELLISKTNDLDTLLLEADDCCELLDAVLQHGNETEVLLIRKEMTEQLFRIKEASKPLPENLFHTTFVQNNCGTLQQYLNSLQALRTCYLGNKNAGPLRIVALGDGLTQCIVGKPTVVTLTTQDDVTNMGVNVDPSSFVCELTSVSEGDADSESVSSNPVVLRSPDDHVGTFTLSYVVVTPGRYQLIVRHDGRHIDGSPFSLLACSVKSIDPLPKPHKVASSKCSIQTSCGALKRPASSSASRTMYKSPSVKNHRSQQGSTTSLFQTKGCATSKGSTTSLFQTKGSTTLLFQKKGCTTSKGSTTSLFQTKGSTTLLFQKKGCATSKGSTTSLFQTKRRPKTPRRVDCVGGGVVEDSGSLVLGCSGTMDCEGTASLILRVGRYGRNKGEFINPQGLCCTPDGEQVAVVDSYNACVQVFSVKTGECQLRFGKKGRSPGHLMKPTGVAVTSSGNYLVSDYENCSVSVYGRNGNYISNLSGFPLVGPKGLSSHNQRIAVVDNKGCAIAIYNSSGHYQYHFRSRSNDETSLSGPHYCAMTSEGHVIVTDFHNHSIKIFEAGNGKLLTSFGSYGKGNGQLDGPTGVAVDKFGNILVADWGNARIQVFDSRGSFLTLVETSADPLYGPQGLDVGCHGNLVIVADSGNQCFKVFRHPFATVV